MYLKSVNMEEMEIMEMEAMRADGRKAEAGNSTFPT